MPRVEAGFINSDQLTATNALIVRGPTVLVHVGFDPKYDQTAGQAPEPGTSDIPALVDTGALTSCIDSALAEELDLPIVDRREVSGVGGKEMLNMHMAQVHIPHLGFTEYGQFAGVHLSAGGQVHRVLLGRSFLTRMIMIYDGPKGTVTITT